jgi:tetratricopeptide (TPR) repeat protein
MSVSSKIFALSALVLMGVAAWQAYRVTVPPDVTAIYQAGLDALSQQQLGAAYVEIEKLTGIQPTPSQAYLLEGAALLRQNNLVGAVSVLKKAANDPQAAGRANHLIGEALYKNRQFQQAINALELAIKADPQLTDAHRLLGAAYYDLGATEPAIKAMETVATQAPEDPRPHRLMGVIYQDMESFEGAAKEFREVMRLAPEHPERAEILSDLAECLLKAGKYEELEGILPDCPLTPRVLVIAASSKNALGKQAAAVSMADEALQMDPKFLDALLLRAALALEQGQVADAIKHLQTAVDTNPAEYRAHYQLSQAYARDGKTEQAEKHAAESNRLRDLRTHFTELHARASVDIKNADLRFELASTAEQLGMKELAVTWLSGALAIDPNHQAARESLRRITQDKVSDTNNAGSLQ